MNGTRRRTDIRLAGSGGQGVVLAGVVLAEAAILDGLQAVQSQAYGPQSRGGASRSDVAIGPEIGFAVTETFDILVALNRDAFERHAACLRRTGLLIADARWVSPAGDDPWSAFLLPMVATAQRGAGGPVPTNMVALGALSGRTGIVTAAALEAAARSRVPEGTWPMNYRALRAGFQLGRSKERSHG